ncbi:MAG: nucleoside kinase [Lachnospiraceae bacterium]
MEISTVQLTIHGQIKEIAKGTTYKEIVAQYQKEYEDDILLVSLNNKLRELHHKAKKSGELIFLTAKDDAGRKAYRRSVTLLMQKALYNLLGKENSRVRILYSVSQAYYCELPEYGKPDNKLIERLLSEMRRLAALNIPIIKSSISTDEAVNLFRELGMTDKEKLFRYRRSSRVNIYDLDGYLDYFYGYMVPDTSYLNYFDAEEFEEGFVLRFPDKETKTVASFQPSKKHFYARQRSSEWGTTMGIDTIGALNDAIAKGETQKLILVQEAIMERRIGQLAQSIVSGGNKKFVMIAGPSSSGKTTFAHRLAIQLSALGLNPHPVSLDNYYLNRSTIPVGEDGKVDLECLEALDLPQFNEDMMRMLNGEQVQMPTFNFVTGEREYKGNTLELTEDNILLIEGIHGLNDKLTQTLPDESKFKIFISPLTQLNIDEHNYLPTTDGRLIRRIVRDARTRNTIAADTIAMWDSVRRGEEQHIFPFQDSADVMFNSALIYELAVLKCYAEPLLFQIDKMSPEYLEAKRLLKFLDYFLPIPGEGINGNSILREFIGGSCFHV